MPPGELPQLLVHERDELIKRGSIAAAPRVKKSGHGASRIGSI
jgi:hypothetical protein